MTKNSYVLLFFFVLICKIFIGYLIFTTDGQFFGGGNDSDYYHAYAIGKNNYAVNIWPIILRWINNNLYYNRGIIIIIINVLGAIAIPFMAANLIKPIGQSLNYNDSKDFWLIALIVAIYPSLYFQTIDIYRDVFMLFIFIFFLFCCKKLSTKHSIFTFILGLLLTYILYQFRPYLGGACLITLVIAPIYSYKRYPFILSLLLYIVALLILYHFHYLDRLTQSYRNQFSYVVAGSNLNLRFTDTNSFIPTFFLSWGYQIFGIFFRSISGIIVFLIESIPFLFCFSYIIKNRKFSNPFVSYLIIFFISYSTVWLLGNDNLGTATRLRIFSYISILIAFFIIRSNKRIYNLTNSSIK